MGSLHKELERLTRMTMLDAVQKLADRDRDLARILRDQGPPPLWARPAGFSTLVLIILEQQVSLASARSAFDRLKRQAGLVTPSHMIALGRPGLRAAGLTRQKTRYILELAGAIDARLLDLRKVGLMDDAAARTTLTTIPGIGPWTANIYLLMALRRPDVWPVYDLALRNSVRALRGLRQAPSDEALQRAAVKWRPYRSVAARMLWHYYLQVVKPAR